MWCDYCQAPVAGVKTTARARNTVATLAAPVTGGTMSFTVQGVTYDPITITDGESLVLALERAGLTVLRNRGVDLRFDAVVLGF